MGLMFCFSRKNKVSFCETIALIFIFTSGGPFGLEECVRNVGVANTFILLCVVAIAMEIPSALIVSEFATMMPSNHGLVLWPYRAFHSFNLNLCDYIGFLNAVNFILFLVIGNCSNPIIMTTYIETRTGSLGIGTKIGIQIVFIFCALLMNIGYLSKMADSMMILCFVCFAPVLIAFLWVSSDINPTEQWNQESTCPTFNFAAAVAGILWKVGGVQSICSIISDIDYEPTKIITACWWSILLVNLSLFLPVMAAATQITECLEWHDGTLASAYKTVSVPLEICYIAAAVIFVWCYFTTVLGLIARLTWAISQPYFEIHGDGRMVIHGEHDDDDGDNDNGSGDQNIKRISINVLPQKWFGVLWERTRSPVNGVIVVSILALILVIVSQFSELVEVALFLYIIACFCQCSAFMFLKYNEPDTPRPFEVMYGKTGAWIASGLWMLCMISSFGLLIYYKWELFLISMAVEVGLSIAYVIAKKYCNRMHQDKLPNDESQNEPELEPLI